MTDFELKDIDSEDFSDILLKVEASFGIRFIDEELVHIKSFGQLCDHISNKIQLENANDCTNQQAFYKLREAIASTLHIDNKKILPDSLLKVILPRQKRRSNTKKLEKHLGFKLNILRQPHWVTVSFAIVIVSSIAILFFNWLIGLITLVFSTAGIWLANKTGNEFNVKTIGQMVEKMTRENYLKSRRNPKTINKKEIEKVLADLFSDYVVFDKINNKENNRK